jgi:hypothetical protein
MTSPAVRVHLEIRDGFDDPLAVIEAIVDSSEAIESALREWVRAARAKGHTWQEVARALHVTRQSAWERFRDGSDRGRAGPDPGFAIALERAYLRHLSGTELDPDADLEAVHEDLLARAIYDADRTNGGLRLRRLDEAGELRTRLRRALSIRAGA